MLVMAREESECFLELHIEWMILARGVIVHQPDEILLVPKDLPETETLVFAKMDANHHCFILCHNSNSIYPM
jgi:hypothetical protein